METKIAPTRSEFESSLKRAAVANSSIGVHAPLWIFVRTSELKALRNSSSFFTQLSPSNVSSFFMDEAIACLKEVMAEGHHVYLEDADYSFDDDADQEEQREIGIKYLLYCAGFSYQELAQISIPSRYNGLLHFADDDLTSDILPLPEAEHHIIHTSGLGVGYCKDQKLNGTGVIGAKLVHYEKRIVRDFLDRKKDPLTPLEILKRVKQINNTKQTSEFVVLEGRDLKSSVRIETPDASPKTQPEAVPTQELINLSKGQEINHTEIPDLLESSFPKIVSSKRAGNGGLFWGGFFLLLIGTGFFSGMGWFFMTQVTPVNSLPFVPAFVWFAAGAICLIALAALTICEIVDSYKPSGDIIQLDVGKPREPLVQAYSPRCEGSTPIFDNGVGPDPSVDPNLSTSSLNFTSKSAGKPTGSNS